MVRERTRPRAVEENSPPTRGKNGCRPERGYGTGTVRHRRVDFREPRAARIEQWCRDAGLFRECVEASRASGSSGHSSGHRSESYRSLVLPRRVRRLSVFKEAGGGGVRRGLEGAPAADAAPGAPGAGERDRRCGRAARVWQRGRTPRKAAGGGRSRCVRGGRAARRDPVCGVFPPSCRFFVRSRVPGEGLGSPRSVAGPRTSARARQERGDGPYSGRRGDWSTCELVLPARSTVLGSGPLADADTVPPECQARLIDHSSSGSTTTAVP